MNNATMRQISTFFALMFLAAVSFSQETHTPKRIIWKVAVKDSIHRVEYGYLAAIADSGVVMVKSPVAFDHSLVATNANTIAYQNLSEIRIQRKGSVGRGILFGALSGMVVGGVVGLISYKKPPPSCQENPFCVMWDFGPGFDAAAGASIGTLAGAAIGGVIGALAKKKFIIGGNRNKFAHMKANVLDMAYRTPH